MGKYKGIRATSLFIGVLFFVASIQISFAAFNSTNWNWNEPIENKTTENITWSNITWSSMNGSTDNITPENTTWSQTNGSVPSFDPTDIDTFLRSRNILIPTIKQLPTIYN
ncbi:hypothetical protein [Methanosarcina barkeri]|uniref:Uncharacterized protein n=1 Tax=Methanosarcina barkeri (strain Fusaro / DSM 804) TaxID=269797 RepID=Q465I6_METBF|nr:hypothetical protein [Methanosarcina barkeri]